MRTQPINLILTAYDLKTISKVKQAWDDWEAAEPGTPEQVQAGHHWKASAEMLAHMLFSKLAQKESMQ